jgi:hypothetical protein
MNDEKDEKEAKEIEQMQLALQGESFLVDYSELPCRYTGDKLKAQYPDRYKVAVKFIAMGQYSDYAIGNFINADLRTIREIRLNQIKDIEEQRELMKQKAFVGYMLLTDKAIELADAAKKPAEAAIPAGIYGDKWLQMSGQPTANIQVDHHFDFNAALNELRKEAEETLKRVKKAQIIDPAALTEGEAA